MPKAIDLPDGDPALTVAYPELIGSLTRYAREKVG